MTERPTGLVVVAVLLVISGLQLISTILFFLGYAGPTPISAIKPILAFGLGALNLLVARGIWDLKSWARTAGIILTVLSLPVGVILGIGALDFLFSIGILYFLMVHKETKKALTQV